MEPLDATAKLAALAQATRLQVFRLLVEAGPEGRNAGAIAEKLRAAVAALAIPSDQAAGEHLHASIAVSPAPAGEPLAVILDRVDRALHRAKQSGRNCVIVARPDI